MQSSDDRTEKRALNGNALHIHGDIREPDTNSDGKHHAKDGDECLAHSQKAKTDQLKYKHGQKEAPRLRAAHQDRRRHQSQNRPDTQS